jgi:protein-tyrosine-phosphatase
MKYVLFVCTHNAGRPQIAQAFFERYARGSDRSLDQFEEAPTRSEVQPPQLARLPPG